MSFTCTTDLSAYLGQSVDDGAGNFPGECVSIVKKFCAPAMPPTKQWRRGAKVQGKKDVRGGTAIATFQTNGRFKSRDGHAAIFVDQDDKGITVWDQFNHPKKGVGTRYLPFKNSKDVTDGNDGSNFYIIEVEP